MNLDHFFCGDQLDLCQLSGRGNLLGLFSQLAKFFASAFEHQPHIAGGVSGVGPGVDISYALVYLKRCRNRFLPSYFDTVATEQDTAKDNQKEKSWYAYTQEKAGESVYWCVLHDVPFF